MEQEGGTMKDISFTHGCSHYHPGRDMNHRCDVRLWAWTFIDTDICSSYDGKRWHPPKPKTVKQPQGAWQTALSVFQGFPYCCQSFQDHPRSHVVISDDEHIIAFNCDCFPTSKGTSEECLGEKCPHCKLVQMDKYEELVKH